MRNTFYYGGLGLVLSLAATVTAQSSRPTDGATDLVKAVNAYLFEQEPPRRATKLAGREDEVADAIIQLLADGPSFLKQLNGLKYDGSPVLDRIRQLITVESFPSGQRERVSRVMIRLFDLPELTPLQRDWLTRSIMGVGTPAAVDFLELVVDNRINVPSGELLVGLRGAIRTGRIPPERSTQVFDLLTRYSQAGRMDLVFEMLAVLDADRLAKWIVDHGMLAASHPYHEAALNIAVSRPIAIDPGRIEAEFSAIHPIADEKAEARCKQLLVLLARANPAKAQLVCDRLEREIVASPKLAPVDATSWRHVVLQGRLAAAGVNRSLIPYRNVAFQHIVRPAVADDIDRVFEIRMDVKVPDIGRYFAERPTPQAFAADVASLKAIGAQKTAELLQDIQRAVGPGGMVPNWQHRVQAVRNLGTPAVLRWTDAIQNPPDDLTGLVLQYQLDHADAFRLFFAACDRVRPAE